MKTRLRVGGVCVVVCALMSSCGSDAKDDKQEEQGEPYADPPTDRTPEGFESGVIANGDFSDDADNIAACGDADCANDPEPIPSDGVFPGWEMFRGAGWAGGLADVEGSIVNGVAKIVLNDIALSTQPWFPKLQYISIQNIEVGKTYDVSFDAVAKEPRKIKVNFGVDMSSDPYWQGLYDDLDAEVDGGASDGVEGSIFEVGNTWHTFTYTFTVGNDGTNYVAESATDKTIEETNLHAAGRGILLSFEFGPTLETVNPNTTLMFDNVSVKVRE